MHTHRCVLIEISMEIGMLNFGLGLLVTALMKETYFNLIMTTYLLKKVQGTLKKLCEFLIACTERVYFDST